MKNLNLDQKGIAHIIPIMLVILVIGVVAFSAYRIGSKDSSKSDDTTVVVKKGEKKQPAEKKKTYQFEDTDLKMDMPESWQVEIEKKTDSNQDGKNDSYNGKIKAINGWGINFTAGQGGFGGGPSCNSNGQNPELGLCPTYSVISRDVLKTGDILINYSSAAATSNGEATNCTIVSSSGDQYNPNPKNVGESFEGSHWTCFSNFRVNKSIPMNGQQNVPALLSLSVEYPYGLDKKVSTDFTKDNDYKAVYEALKTLRNN